MAVTLWLSVNVSVPGDPAFFYKPLTEHSYFSFPTLGTVRMLTLLENMPLDGKLDRVSETLIDAQSPQLLVNDWW